MSKNLPDERDNKNLRNVSSVSEHTAGGQAYEYLIVFAHGFAFEA